jgi:hypothetical protein
MIRCRNDERPRQCGGARRPGGLSSCGPCEAVDQFERSGRGTLSLQAEEDARMCFCIVAKKTSAGIMASEVNVR